VYHLRLDDVDQRDKFIAYLKESGILAVFHYQPLHLSTVGRTLGGKEGQHPVTEEAGDCLVRLPLFNSMTDEQQSQVIHAVKEFS
jgi:dTDP-4-amino-4,6-dideoxygalactose transaminase